jgi:hypothetical protein
VQKGMHNFLLSRMLALGTLFALTVQKYCFHHPTRYDKRAFSPTAPTQGFGIAILVGPSKLLSSRPFVAHPSRICTSHDYQVSSSSIHLLKGLGSPNLGLSFPKRPQTLPVAKSQSYRSLITIVQFSSRFPTFLSVMLRSLLLLSILSLSLLVQGATFIGTRASSSLACTSDQNYVSNCRYHISPGACFPRSAGTVYCCGCDSWRCFGCKSKAGCPVLAPAKPKCLMPISTISTIARMAHPKSLATLRPS